MEKEAIADVLVALDEKGQKAEYKTTRTAIDEPKLTDLFHSTAYPRLRAVQIPADMRLSYARQVL